MTAELAGRLRAGRSGAWRRRRYSEGIRRQRGADVPVTRRSDAVAIESPGQTLEDVLSCAWEDLAIGRRAECPVCGGQMQINIAATTSGSCQGCESQLE